MTTGDEGVSEPGRYDWRPFLETWSWELVADPGIRQQLPSEVVSAGWLGYNPASEDEIVRAERRLEAQLPASYRDFLRVTNGWRNTGYFVRNLWSVEDIDWHAARHQDLIDAWIEGESYYGEPSRPSDDEYFVYGPDQTEHSLRSEYLPSALQISEIDDGVYLLNPKITTPQGEWEAWYFAEWLPGARRYRSFWEMMQAEREHFLLMRAARAGGM